MKELLKLFTDLFESLKKINNSNSDENILLNLDKVNKHVSESKITLEELFNNKFLLPNQKSGHNIPIDKNPIGEFITYTAKINQTVVTEIIDNLKTVIGNLIKYVESLNESARKKTLDESVKPTNKSIIDLLKSEEKYYPKLSPSASDLKRLITGLFTKLVNLENDINDCESKVFSKAETKSLNSKLSKLGTDCSSKITTLDTGIAGFLTNIKTNHSELLGLLKNGTVSFLEERIKPSPSGPR